MEMNMAQLWNDINMGGGGGTETLGDKKKPNVTFISPQTSHGLKLDRTILLGVGY
jgi:hypothetical protein